MQQAFFPDLFWQIPKRLSDDRPSEQLMTDDQLQSDSVNSRLDLFLAAVEQDAYRLVLAAIQDPDETVDLLQNAMMQLITRYRDRDEEQWRPLFHRIIQNHIRDWYRRRKVKHALLRWTGLGDTTEQVISIPDEVQEHPDSLAESLDELTEINAAIQQLPLRQQQAFLLRAWQEMTVEETAFAMQISTGSVKTHYSRALTFLREYLTRPTEES